MVFRRTSVYFTWAIMDIFHIALYVFGSMSNGNIPYYNDALLIAESVSSHGGAGAATFFVGSLLLQLSIPFSGFMLWTRSNYATKLCYLQTPFRLLFIVPSISLIPILAGVFQDAILIVLLALSEACKVVSLFYLSRGKKRIR